MNANQQGLCVIGYALGGLVDWAYWIANPWIHNGIPELGGTIMIGWFVALAWPLHLLVKMWEWVL